jgi:hypothetical protein
MEAVAELIYASLSDADSDLPPRLRAIRFPAALEWIRFEDVARVASAYRPAISKKAILNRWPTKEELVQDAAVYCITHDNLTSTITPAVMVEAARSHGLAEAIRYSAEAILDSLILHPRSFLLMHLAPMLPRHDAIREQVAADAARVQHQWALGYTQLISEFGITLRPEWTPARISMALQMLLDGHMIRHRGDAAHLTSHARAESTIFADAVLALIVGAVDHPDRDGTAAEVIDQLARERPPAAEQPSMITD